jgi:hypothetical protein
VIQIVATRWSSSATVSLGGEGTVQPLQGWHFIIILLPGVFTPAGLFDPFGVVSRILLPGLSMTMPFSPLNGWGDWGDTSQMASGIGTDDAESVEEQSPGCKPRE